MDTREPIQSGLEPAVLSVAFNEKASRFTCGLANGLRSFRSHDCVETIREAPRATKPNTLPSVVLAAQLDDRYYALVGTATDDTADVRARHVVQFWDNLEARKVTQLDLAEPILGLCVGTKVLSVVLLERVVCFNYLTLSEPSVDDGTRPSIAVPALIAAIHSTAPNPYAICSARRDSLALPGLTPGQVQIVHFSLSPGQKTSRNIVRAHASGLRQLALSDDAQYLATASNHGTLIRVFSTVTLAQTHEFRRGVDDAIIYSISISPSNQFVATTSDKGTLHIFDLRSKKLSPSLGLGDRIEVKTEHTDVRRKTSVSRPVAAAHQYSPVDFDAQSLNSAPSPSRLTGAFYGLPPDLSHQPPASGPSALSALAKMPGMPRALSDARSMTSATYHLGTDSRRTKVDPSPTRAPKGILAWDPEGGDRRLWCVGGGCDARWEVFELVAVGVGGDDGGRLKVVKTGFRRYLTRQFPAT